VQGPGGAARGEAGEAEPTGPVGGSSAAATGRGRRRVAAVADGASATAPRRAPSGPSGPTATTPGAKRGARGAHGARTARAEAGTAGGSDPWTLRYTGFDPATEGLREALCAIGNGLFVSRAAAPESAADGVHYPGTYFAGGYHRSTSRVHDRDVENEDLVNGPNWLPLSFRAAGDDRGPWFGEPGFLPDRDSQELELDLHTGILTRRVRCRDRDGRTFRLVQRRLAHMGWPNLAVLETVLTPENWSGPLEVRSALDGRVVNSGVARYRDLNGRHLVPFGQGGGGTRDGLPRHADPVWLQVGAPDAALRIAAAARTRVRSGEGADTRPPSAVSVQLEDGYAAQVFTIEARSGEPVTIEKTVALCTTRDRALADPAVGARRLAAAAPDVQQLVREHRLRWAELWRRCPINTDLEDHGTIHLYLFHLLQTFSIHSVDLDVGIPARGLHGEAYRGHVFWDELFILPTLNLRVPELSRAVLLYRYRRLGEARRAAAEAGFRGAMYPWQSGSDGREETQTVHLNPRSGRWLPDSSHLQRHVGAAVAYNIWEYYQATGDLEFLAGYGAEMLLEIARFWSSAAQYDPALRRYRIRGVMGPDEYHDAYPWESPPGLDDNAYTNVLTSWLLARALDCLPLLPEYRRGELLERLGLDQLELDRWEEVSRRMLVPFHDGVISQFAGYERLEELDWKAYRKAYGDIRRLDRILEAEGDSTNRYRASKQADVLMLWYLFPPAEVRALLERLGYDVTPELMDDTVEYYTRRTAHGSTLSAVVHAWVLARRDRAASWRFFREAVDSDIHDVQGGTTAEGIHLGAMAGTVDLLQRCYPGLETRGDILRLDPMLPEPLGMLDMELRYRGHWGIRLHINHKVATIELRPGQGAPIKVGIGDTVYTLHPGESQEHRL